MRWHYRYHPLCWVSLFIRHVEWLQMLGPNAGMPETVKSMCYQLSAVSIESHSPVFTRAIKLNGLVSPLKEFRDCPNRNGSWYSESDARAFRWGIPLSTISGYAATTEDFIGPTMASSMRRKPYHSPLDAREPVSNAEWLSTELQRLRSFSCYETVSLITGRPNITQTCRQSLPSFPL